MKALFALIAIVLALLLFTPDSHEYQGEDVEEAIRILEDLETRGLADADSHDDDADLERREEEEDLDARDYCDGLCHPDDPCDCVDPDCEDSDCDTTRRGIQTDLRALSPSKKFFGRRLCRRRYWRRTRVCRIRIRVGKK